MIELQQEYTITHPIIDAMHVFLRYCKLLFSFLCLYSFLAMMQSELHCMRLFVSCSYLRQTMMKLSEGSVRKIFTHSIHNLLCSLSADHLGAVRCLSFGWYSATPLQPQAPNQHNQTLQSEVCLSQSYLEPASFIITAISVETPGCSHLHIGGT